MRKLLDVLRYFLFLSVAAGCANQVTPAGGPRDLEPPAVESSTPENFSTNFHQSEIRIVFNEFIDVKELSSQLVVSPPMRTLPKWRVRKNTLILEILDTLKPNTTYSLNFGRSIVDLNEGNPLMNYAFVFSTGDVLDTMSITGTVHQAAEQTPALDTKVMLYTDRSDSVPYLSLPLYFGMTDSSGAFRIANISAGMYKVFALKETDNNYLYGSPAEGIAFRPGEVAAGTENISLRLFRELPPGRLSRAFSEQPGKAVVVLQGPGSEGAITMAGDTTGIGFDRLQWNRRGDTAVVWYRNLQHDSLLLLVHAGTRTDTAFFRLQRSDERTGKQRRFGLYLNAPEASRGQIVPSRPIQITASQPIVFWDERNFVLTEDTTQLPVVLRPDSSGLSAAVDYDWKEGPAYTLLLQAGAATDINGLKSDTMRWHFQARKRIEFGTIEVKLSSDAFPSSCLFQLVNEKSELIRETTCARDTTVYYEFLEPGVYRLRMVRDDNKNEKEDTGHYLSGQQPELSTWYPDKITVRANWDVELSWKAGFVEVGE